MRFACVFVPHFAVQVAMRCESTEKRKENRPVAILDGPDSLLRVFACNPAAQLAGIEIGMTKAQAEQCPGLVIRKRVVAHENAAQSALIDCGLAFSPLVESTEQGAVIFEITGTNRAFGPPKTLARRIVQSTALLGLGANVAIASNPDAALVAAKGFSGITMIPSGEEAKCLSPLPVEVLSPTVEQAEILDSWGIRTCGDLATLPRVPLVERLGQAGLRLHTLALGQVQRNLILAEPPRKFEEHLELEDSVEDLESLAFLLNRLLNQLSARLSARGLAVNEIRLRLDLEVHRDRDLRQELNEQPLTAVATPWIKVCGRLAACHTDAPLPVSGDSDSAVFERRLRFPIPIEETKTLLKLLQLDLATHSPGAPVKAVAMEAMPAKPRYTQAGLFSPRAPEPEKLEITLARLRSVVGEVDDRGRSRAGAPRVRDSHKPDDFQVVPFTSQSEKRNPSSSSRSKTEIALSMFRPPLTARVRRKGKKPAHISFAEFSVPIVCAAGPWFTSGLWWDEDGKWNREEWDIAIRMENGIGLYRIFRENQKWFVEGLYD